MRRQRKIRLTNRTKKLMGVKGNIFKEDEDKMAQWIFNSGIDGVAALRNTISSMYDLLVQLKDIRPTLITLEKSVTMWDALKNKAMTNNISPEIEDVIDEIKSTIDKVNTMDRELSSINDKYWKLANE